MELSPEYDIEEHEIEEQAEELPYEPTPVLEALVPARIIEASTSVRRDPDELAETTRIRNLYLRDNPPGKIIIASGDDAERKIKQVVLATRIETGGRADKTDYGSIYFTDVTATPPKRKTANGEEPLYPNTAHKEGLTYAFTLAATMHYVPSNTGGIIGGIGAIAETEEIIEIAQVPLMLGSSVCYLSKVSPEERASLYRECPNDPLGYFVIEGKYRNLIAQEKLAMNVTMVIDNKTEKKDDVYCSILCTTSTSSISKIDVRKRKIKDTEDHEVVLTLPTPLPQREMNIVEIIRLIQLSIIQHTNKEELSIDATKTIINELIEEVAQSEDEEDVMVIRMGNFLRETVGMAMVQKSDATFFDEKTKLMKLSDDPDEVLKVIARDFFPHITTEFFTREGVDQEEALLISLRVKQRMLMYMAFRVMVYTEKYSPNEKDDRDHFGLKRGELAGELLFALVSKSMQRNVRNILKKIDNTKGDKSLASIVKKEFISKSDQTITNTCRKSFTTDNWGVPGRVSTTQGVAQLLETDSLPSIIANIRKITSKGDQAKRKIDPHLVHGSHRSIICQHETKDDTKCGIVKYLAMSADVSRPTDAKRVLEIARMYLNDQSILLDTQLSILDTFKQMQEYNATNRLGQDFVSLPFFVNGTWIGYAPRIIVKLLRLWRRGGRLVGEEHEELSEGEMGRATISVYVDRKVRDGNTREEIHLVTTANRLVRPLYIVDEETQELLMDKISREQPHLDLWSGKHSWRELVYVYQVIEYIDKKEEERSYPVAWFPGEVRSKRAAYKYCELDPIFIKGYGAANIIFAEYSSGTRVAYAANMIKHSVGIPTQHYEQRFDTTLKVLVTPQRPLVDTDVYRAVGMEDQPTSSVPIVACLVGGNNQEDAIILNKSSVDRGLFHSITFSTVKIPASTGQFDIPLAQERTEKKKQAPRERADFGVKTFRTTAPKIVAGKYTHLATPHKLPSGQELPKGIVRPGTKVQFGDILATKVKPDKKDVAESQYPLEKRRVGIVDDIYLVEDLRSQGAANIKIRYPNLPKVGNKYASSVSQKGVCGQLVNREDMPVSESGITPDLVMNPHSFPSRQTISQILETLFGKARIVAPFSTLTGFTDASYNHSYRVKDVQDFYVRPSMIGVWLRNTPEKQLYKDKIEQLYRQYKKTKEWVLETTIRDTEVKKVPYSYIKTVDSTTAEYIITTFGDKYLVLVDVITISSGSSAQELLELENKRRLQGERERIGKGAQNATPFNQTVTVDEVSALMAEIGWSDSGDEIFYNGKTGEELRCRVFQGPNLYHTMTQMVDDKIQARGSTGKISAGTRQPAEGKKVQGGGQREEMFTTAGIGAGASAFIQESLSTASAVITILQCSACGQQCPIVPIKEFQCNTCRSRLPPVKLRNIPFATLHMKYLLEAMSVKMTFGTELARELEQQDEEEDIALEDRLATQTLLPYK